MNASLFFGWLERTNEASFIHWERASGSLFGPFPMQVAPSCRAHLGLSPELAQRFHASECGMVRKFALANYPNEAGMREEKFPSPQFRLFTACHRFAAINKQLDTQSE